MPEQKQVATSEFILGEMASTVKSIDQNVNAIRGEMSDVSKRLGHVETDVATIQADRNATAPEHIIFVKNVRDHMEEFKAWKNQVDGSIKTVKGGGKIFHGFLVALGTLALFIAGQIWSDARAAADHVVAVQAHP